MGSEVRAMRYFVWTLLVWVPITVIAILLPDTNCSGDFCFGPSSHDIILGLVFLIGLPVYFIGLILIWGVSSSGSRWER
jgi:hypothetical protein